jgi:hypothetical protein
MCYHLTHSNGNTEAVIDDNCGISKFYAIANTLAQELKIIFLNQVDEAESLEWDFRYKNALLTLHYSIFNGVSILPVKAKYGSRENKAVLKLASFLEKKAY